MFFCVQRTFLGRLYVRVSYGSVWLKFSRVEIFLLLGLAKLYYGLAVFTFFFAFRCLFG